MVIRYLVADQGIRIQSGRNSVQLSPGRCRSYALFAKDLREGRERMSALVRGLVLVVHQGRFLWTA